MLDVSVPDDRNIVRTEAWKIEWSDVGLVENSTYSQRSVASLRCGRS